MSCKVEMKFNKNTMHSLKINGSELGEDCYGLKLEWNSGSASAKITLELNIDELEIDEIIKELEINKKLIGIEGINDRNEILDL